MIFRDSEEVCFVCFRRRFYNFFRSLSNGFISVDWLVANGNFEHWTCISL